MSSFSLILARHVLESDYIITIWWNECDANVLTNVDSVLIQLPKLLVILISYLLRLGTFKKKLLMSGKDEITRISWNALSFGINISIRNTDWSHLDESLTLNRKYLFQWQLSTIQNITTAILALSRFGSSSPTVIYFLCLSTAVMYHIISFCRQGEMLDYSLLFSLSTDGFCEIVRFNAS